MSENEQYDSSVTTILIVDDIPTNIQLALGILQKARYNITFTTSGEEALKKLEKIEVDLILLDVMMPGMDGFEVCRKIRETPKLYDIPIIFLTGRAEVDNIVQGFDAGGQDYILKPFNGRELLSRVKNQLMLRYTKNLLKEEIENRRKIQNELEIANRSKDKLFSIVAHDLNNPFTALMMSVEQLESQFDYFTQEDIRKYIRQMKL